MNQAEDVTDFFISYANSDRAWAEWVAWQLHITGYTVLLQAWNFLPGSDFMHKMHHAVANAKKIVAILSPDYFASKFSEAEWRAVLARDPTGEKGLLVPVRVYDFQPPGLLATRVYVDLVDRDAFEAKDALLRGVTDRGMRPSQEPRFPGGANFIKWAKFPGIRPTAKHRPVAKSDIVDVPSGYALVRGPWAESSPLSMPVDIAIATELYGSLKDLLDDLFINYLHSIVPPYSYGSEWILTMDGFAFIAPLAWAVDPGEPISQIAPDWAGMCSLNQLLIQSGSVLGISSIASENVYETTGDGVYGVVADDKRIIAILIKDPKAIALLDDYLKARPLSEIGPIQDRFTVVLRDWLRRRHKGQIYDAGSLTVEDLPRWLTHNLGEYS